MSFHQCDMSAYDLTPSMCICAIGRDHDADEMEAWEANDWQDPNPVLPAHNNQEPK